MVVRDLLSFELGKWHEVAGTRTSCFFPLAKRRGICCFARSCRRHRARVFHARINSMHTVTSTRWPIPVNGALLRSQRSFCLL